MSLEALYPNFPFPLGGPLMATFSLPPRPLYHSSPIGVSLDHHRPLLPPHPLAEEKSVHYSIPPSSYINGPTTSGYINGPTTSGYINSPVGLMQNSDSEPSTALLGGSGCDGRLIHSSSGEGHSPSTGGEEMSEEVERLEHELGNTLVKRKRRERHPERWKKNNYHKKPIREKGKCSCREKCFEKIPEADRKRIREHFDSLKKRGKVEENKFLLAHISTEKAKKSKGTDALTSGPKTGRHKPKQFVSHYFVDVQQQDPNGYLYSQTLTRVRVCRAAFLSIIGVGHKRVLNLLTNAFAGRSPKRDGRGKHHTRVNRVNEELVIMADEHIKSFPRYAIVNRNKLTWRNTISSSPPIPYHRHKYLSPALSLLKMYRLFIAQYQPILLRLEKVTDDVKVDRFKRRAHTYPVQPRQSSRAKSKVASAPLRPTSTPRRRKQKLKRESSPALLASDTSFAPLHLISLASSKILVTDPRSRISLNPTTILGDPKWSKVFEALRCSLCGGGHSSRDLRPVFWHHDDLKETKTPKKKSSSKQKVPTPHVSFTLLALLDDECFEIFRHRFRAEVQKRIQCPYENWTLIPIENFLLDLKPLISLDKYERMFHTFNLKFGSADDDGDCLCKAKPGKSKEVKEVENKLLQLHLERANQGAALLQFAKNRSAQNWSGGIESFTGLNFSQGTMELLEVGWQPNRPIPQLGDFDSILNFRNPEEHPAYQKSLWVYFFGIYSSTTSQVAHSHMWDETVGKRRVNEMLSCLWRHIDEQKKSKAQRAPWLAIVGDGLNNYWSLCFLAELCREGSTHFSYRRVDYKMLESGHSYLDIDRALQGLDNEGRTHSFYSPKQWMEAVNNISHKTACKSKHIQLEGKWMSSDHFFNWKALLTQFYDRKLSNFDLSNEPVDLKQVVWFNFGVGEETTTEEGQLKYHPDEVWVRYALNVNEPWKKIRLRKDKEPRSPLPVQYLYAETPLPISYQKAKAAHEMRVHIPLDYHNKYPLPRSPAESQPDGNLTEEEEEYESDDIFLPPRDDSLVPPGSQIDGERESFSPSDVPESIPLEESSFPSLPPSTPLPLGLTITPSTYALPCKTSHKRKSLDDGLALSPSSSPPPVPSDSFLLPPPMKKHLPSKKEIPEAMEENEPLSSTFSPFSSAAPQTLSPPVSPLYPLYPLNEPFENGLLTLPSESQDGSFFWSQNVLIEPDVLPNSVIPTPKPPPLSLSSKEVLPRINGHVHDPYPKQNTIMSALKFPLISIERGV